MMRTAVGYVRVSTEKQAAEGVSLAAQRAKIAAWCELNDYALVAVHADEGVGGGSMKGREGLAAALAASTKGAALICYSLSRLARSTRDMLTIADRLERQGADLVSLSERIDTTTAAGRMVFRMLAVLAEFERDQIGERTKLALAHKRATGRKYAPVPFGFTEIEGRLVTVKTEAAILQRILADRDAGRSYREIAAALNGDRVATKRRGQRWYASTVRSLVQRPQIGATV